MAVRLTRAGVALTVGIIILTGMIVGGLFILKNSGEQARREDAIEVAQQNLEKQSDNDTALNEGTPDKEPEADKSGDAGNETAPEEAPVTGTSPAPGALPQTGTGDTILALLAVAALAYAGASYYRSRHAAL